VVLLRHAEKEEKTEKKAEKPKNCVLLRYRKNAKRKGTMKNAESLNRLLRKAIELNLNSLALLLLDEIKKESAKK